MDQVVIDLQEALYELAQTVNEKEELIRQCGQLLCDYDLLSRPTWDRKRKELLEKLRRFGVLIVPF